MSFLIFFLICMWFSAFCSGAEMAYVSSNNLKIRELADDGDPLAKPALNLLQEPQQFLTTILISNNIFNVAATAILTYVFQMKFHIESEWAVTAIMAPLLIIFGEMVPKDYCRIRSQYFLLKNADTLVFLTKFFYYPVKFILAIIEVFLKPLDSSSRKNIFVSEDEFKSLIEESIKTGVIDVHEKKLITTILDFEKIKVTAVFKPIDRIAKINITEGNVKQVKDIARETKARMVLVYEDDPSIIVGMVYVFDLLFEKNEKLSLKNYLRAPVFLKADTSIETAFLTLQQKRQSYAVVTNAMNEAIGVVPVERLLVMS